MITYSFRLLLCPFLISSSIFHGGLTCISFVSFRPIQVIKVLLVAITSEYCNVHEGGLLLAVRACFHVNLITKNQANKTTAKAALTQMLSVVNQRMEVHETRLKASASASTPPSQSPSSSSKSKLDKQTVEIEDGDDVAKLDSADSEDANVAPLSRGTLSSSVTVSERLIHLFI